MADLRSLRDAAAIGYDELAARAHFPSDILKEAENGPVLPGLPILTAYVRACEGDVTEWEERWRRLASEVPEDPGLPVRPAGASPAAVAGARAGVGIAPPDVYDPERIRAALRAGHESSDQDTRRTNRSGWDTRADQTIKTANGIHAVDSWSAKPADAADSWSAKPADAADSWSAKPADAADSWSAKPADAADRPDRAKSAEHTDQFQWLPDNGSASRPADKGQADTGQVDTVDVAPAEPTAGEWTPWHHDRVLQPPEQTDIWTTQKIAASADLRLPATASRRVEEQDLTQPTWSTPTETTPTETTPTETTPTETTPTETTAASSARSGAGKTTATKGADHQKDRFSPVVRLLVILVIAALIGSALVLLLK